MGLKSDILQIYNRNKDDFRLTTAQKELIVSKWNELSDSDPIERKRELLWFIMNLIPIHVGLRNELSQYYIDNGITIYN